jgi:diguanylate cyclase (GGDEF)-like protein
MLRLQTLGELRLVGPDGAPRLAGRRKELALLAYLARGAPAGVPRAELAALLWGEREEGRARQSLRQAVLTLKQGVGDAVVVTPERVAIAPGAVELDAAAFEDEVASGRVAAAIERWRGDFLITADDAGGESFRLWVDAERARLRSLLVRALERWTGEAEFRGDWAAMAERAERWVRTFPADVRPRAALVQALHLDGRADEALARHAEFSARLALDGEEPLPPEWVRLGERIERERRAAPAAPQRPGGASHFAPDMVGRDAAFGELRAAWEAARGGGSAVVLVTGEEGSGKTRLVEELLRWAERADGERVVLRARAYESERDTPWSAAGELLAPLREAPGLGGASAQVLGEMAALVPGVRERFRSLPEPSGSERAVHDAVAHALGCVAEEAPVLLVLEDLPQADPASQRLAFSLARHLPGAGVLLVVTARAGDSSWVAGDLGGIPVLRRIRLAPLTADDTGALLETMFDLPADERRALAAKLHAESGGNPRYIVELVTSLVEEGYVALDAHGCWRAPDAGSAAPLPLPAGVREVVDRRLARLSDTARDVLGAAAVLGDRFDVGRLQEAGGFSAEALSAALDEIVVRRLVREVPGTLGRYSFAHSVIRRVAYDRLLPARREALLRTGEPPPPSWYRRIWATPEAAFLDAGAEGEWLAARVRLVLAVLLLVPPVLNLWSERSGVYLAGFAVSAAGVAVAATLHVLLRRGGYRPWLGFASSATDVSLVSAGLLGFALVGDLPVAANSRWVFHVYYLAVVGASLRYDPRICIFAGAVAVLEYGAIMAYAAARWDEAVLSQPFDWVTQVARMILLGVTALLAWQIVRQARRLRLLAFRDPVSGLANRAFFDPRAVAEIERARRLGYPAAVALLEVDGFRQLHRRFGSPAGDDVIRAAAAALRQRVRATDLMARQREDRFVLLVPQANRDEILGQVDAIREELAARLLRLRDHTEVGRVTLTAGIALFPVDGNELEELAHVADARLRAAREAGGDRVDAGPLARAR